MSRKGVDDAAFFGLNQNKTKKLNLPNIINSGHVLKIAATATTTTATTTTAIKTTATATTATTATTTTRKVTFKSNYISLLNIILGFDKNLRKRNLGYIKKRLYDQKSRNHIFEVTPKDSPKTNK